MDFGENLIKRLQDLGDEDFGVEKFSQLASCVAMKLIENKEHEGL